MKKRILQGVVLAFATFAMVSFDNTKGWILAGSTPQNYEMGENITANHEGRGVALIKSKSTTTTTTTGFGALMKQLNASTFLGKRVKVTAIVKSAGIAEWGGIWLSVNQPLNSQVISMQNLQHTTITGTKNAYSYVQIVMDVPQNSQGIAYGTLLKGSGQIWSGRLFFDIVEKSVPLSNN